MNRFAALSALAALSTCLSCEDNVDLGGKNTPLESGGEAGDTNSTTSGGTSGNATTGGADNGGTSSGRGGSTNGGDAGMAAGGTGGDAGASSGGTGGTAGDGMRGGAAGAGGAAGDSSPGGAGFGGAGSGGTGMGGAAAGSGGPSGAGGGGSCGMSASGAGGASGGAAGSVSCSCVPQEPSVGVESCVLDAGGQPVLSLVEASVTVVSVDDVTSGACQAVDGSGPGATSKRIVLEASDQRRWTLVLRIPNLPSDFIRPTDAFELELQGQPPVNPFVRPNQVIMLSRSTELLVFAFVNRFPLPGTTPIDVSDDGEVCSSDLGFTCILSRRRLRVVADGIADTLPPGATRRLGTFSVTVGAASRIGGSQCDSPPSTFKVAGFAVPQ